MYYSFTTTVPIRDFYEFQVFLYKNQFTGITSITSSGYDLEIGYSPELTIEQQAEIQNLIDNVYTNPYPNEHGSEESRVFSENCTTTALAANATFTGHFEDVTNYSTVSVFASSNVSSKAKGLILEFSSDGTTVDYTKNYSLTGGAPFIECVTVFLKYFRVKYINGWQAQTTFTLQTMCYRHRSKSALDTTQLATFTIAQESKSAETGGHFRSEGKSIFCPANSTQTSDYSWDYNISPLAIKFNTSAEQKGHVINTLVIPAQPVGVLAAPVSPGDTVVTVSSSVFQYLAIGYQVILSNGTDTDNLGEVTLMNQETNQITVQTPATNSFSAGTTYINLAVHIVKDFIINNPSNYEIGDTTAGATYLPKGVKIRLVYQNNTNDDTTFVWSYELFY